MAEELGYYARYALAPQLRRAASPVEVRDRLIAGELLAAQMPASLPLAAVVAAAGARSGDLVTLMVLSQHGSAVTLAHDFCGGTKTSLPAQRVRGVGFLDLEALRSALERRAAGGGGPAVFAVPVRGGSNDLLLRYLLAAAGVGPDLTRLVEAPIERMPADLREERIAGFAAPDPWPAMAASQDLGFTFATAQDIWRRAPQSVLVTTARALESRRPELKAVVRAVLEAAVWLDVPSNRARPLLGEVLARRQALDLDAGPIRGRLGSVYDLGCGVGEKDFEDDVLLFHHAGRVNLPRRADMLLYLALLTRFGLGPAPARTDAIERTIRDELYREVARDMGVPAPDDMKPFVVTLDAVRFDPNAPADWPRLW
jgi:ABC-type nitrate/sulfonate/bicarbonate transport system substrate-binding protein